MPETPIKLAPHWQKFLAEIGRAEEKVELGARVHPPQRHEGP